MVSQEEAASLTTNGAAFPWILEHLLTYPGTYEIPLRTMYTLNCASLSQPPSGSSSPLHPPGNAFPPSSPSLIDDQHQLSTATAAAQLRVNLMTHISQLSSQPASLPPSFITSFVRKCFTVELNQVDFPQALTAMDYLKDLEVRRRMEVVMALEKLGINKTDIAHRDQISKKYPGVTQWIEDVEDKERTIEALYSQVYIGLRRWTLINEMSLLPFNKANCIAMLNTLYPPMGITSSQFVQPTAQLTSQILSEQRNGFFRYITAVEKKGAGVLTSLMQQHKRMGDETGWPSLRESIDNYLRMANSIIEECYEISGHGSPTAASFSSAEADEDHKRKVDSGISFASSGGSSNRDSGHSHSTRPSTSSSMSTQSRRASREKQLPEKPLPVPAEEEGTASPSPKAAGSTLERIARELRRMRSRSNVKDESKSRSLVREQSQGPEESSTPAGKTLRLKRSLKKMRSSSGLRESSSRPHTSEGATIPHDVPAFDAEEMRLRRQAWEASQLNN
ncbi:hypothetical protein R6Q59_010133 [Mikania micrantha]